MSACDEIRPLVSALQDGELTPGEAAPVRAHLATCASCREVLESHAALADLVSRHARMPRIEPGDWASFEETLELELSRARGALPRRPFARLLAFAPVLSAAAAVLLALGLGRALLSEDRSVALAYTPLHLPEAPFREPALEGASPRAPSRARL
jgi:anti-sigma factor RsiW